MIRRACLLPFTLALAVAAGCGANRQDATYTREEYRAEFGVDAPGIALDPPCIETVRGTSYRPSVRLVEGPREEDTYVLFTNAPNGIELPDEVTTIPAGQMSAPMNGDIEITSFARRGLRKFDVFLYESEPNISTTYLFSYPVAVRGNVIRNPQTSSRADTLRDGSKVVTVEYSVFPQPDFVPNECPPPSVRIHASFEPRSEGGPVPTISGWAVRVARPIAVLETGESYPPFFPRKPWLATIGPEERKIYSVVISSPPNRIGPPVPSGTVHIRMSSAGDEQILAIDV